MKIKSFHKNVKLTGLDLTAQAILHRKFFVFNDYEWWYRPLPADIIVDLGANCGLFSCLALDEGADEVYMVEPNTALLRNAIYNVSPHMMNALKKPKIVAINAAIGDTENRIDHVDQPEALRFQRSVDMLKFDDFISQCELTHIDFLKVNINGGEYDIFNKDRLDFFKTNVRHMAIAFHLDNQSRRAAFIDVRETFLKKFLPEEQVNANDMMHQKLRFQNWNIFTSAMFGDIDEYAKSTGYQPLMAYITNW